MPDTQHFSKFVVIGVNYASFQYARMFAESWAGMPAVSRVVLVDNFASEAERRAMRSLAELPKVTVLELENVGYGSALNHAVGFVRNLGLSRDTLLLMGNVDIAPVSVGSVSLPADTVPEIAVLEGQRNRNPFLTCFQKRMLPLYELAARRHSMWLLSLSTVITKVASLVPSSTWAVHGAFFAVPLCRLDSLGSIFSRSVFLYCEELFFARAVERAGCKFRRCGLAVSHVGAVSTGRILKMDKRRFFDNWCRSMLEYAND